MAASTISLPYAPVDSLRRSVAIYLREAKYELFRAARNKAFALASIGLPTMFYVLFGVANRGESMHGGQNVAKYLLAGYAAFGTVGAALFGIGVGLALERTSGWLELKRASPMPPLAYLVARCATAVIFSVAIVTLLCVIGISLAGVHLSPGEYLRMITVAVIGSVPFAAMGLLLAALLPPTSAPGIINMIYLPMSYCSGLWVPFAFLPHWVQRLAPWLPTYHLSQLMLHIMGYAVPGDSLLRHALALSAFTVLFLAAAAFAFRRIDADA